MPTRMLRAPIGNPAAKRCSLCNPSFSSQVYVQTAKTQPVIPALKMQKEACAGVWHRLPFGRKCRRKERQFLLHSRDPRGGDEGKRIGPVGIVMRRFFWGDEGC